MHERCMSIIVPSYNMEKYLPKCLGSLIVAPELMEKLEVLVVNDGSKDRTSEIAHEFAAKWPRTFVVIDKENGHYGSCVNAALKLATGLFVKLLDADDTYETENFSALLKFIIDHCDDADFSDVDCLVTNFCTINANGTKIWDWNYRIIRNRGLSLGSIPRHYAFAMHAVAWRRDMLRRINYVQSEGIAYTDTEWSLYPLVAVRRLYYFPISVYCYLVEREGQSMDPQVFTRCVGQRVKMFMRMMRESRRNDYSDAARYRLRYVAMSGVRALFNRAFAERMESIDSNVALVDDAIMESGADVYAEFDIFPFVRAWRRNRHMTRAMKVVWSFETSVIKASNAVKVIMKKILYGI